MTGLRTQAARPEGKPETQPERIAKLYNEKVKNLAASAAAREGRPYGTTEVDLDALAAIWNEPDPKVNEAQVWHDQVAKAAQALADDPSLVKDEVLAELPIEVARIVYPGREGAIKAMGGDGYEDWTANAEKLAERARKLRETQAKAKDKPEQPGFLTDGSAPEDPSGSAPSGDEESSMPAGGSLIQPVAQPAPAAPPAMPAPMPVAAPVAAPVAPMTAPVVGLPRGPMGAPMPAAMPAAAPMALPAAPPPGIRPPGGL